MGGCVDPKEVIVVDGNPSGIVRCADGSFDRIASVGAPTTITGSQGCHPMGCTTAADCVDGFHGACVSNDVSDCWCVYSCDGDAECGADQGCLPPTDALPRHETWGLCVAATCASGADCPSGECGVSIFDDGCGPEISFHCRVPYIDLCRTDADCPHHDEQCAWSSGDDRFTCHKGGGCSLR